MKKHNRFLSIVLVLSLLLCAAVPALGAALQTIESWAWTKNCNLRNGVLYLAPAHYYESDILMRLPSSILVNDGRELTVGWDCPDFPSEGVSWGTYDFDVILPEDYVTDPDCPQIFVRVIIVYPQEEASASHSSAPVNVAKREPIQETVTEGNKTTTTITYPDGTKDVIITYTDEKENIIQENRIFPDGYFTYSVYKNLTYEENVNHDRSYHHSVNVMVWEGYYNMNLPDYETQYPQVQRPKSDTRYEYNENGVLLYKHVDTPIYSDDDPADSGYHYDNYTGQTPRVAEYFVYDPDGTVRTYDSADVATRKLISETWTDENGVHTKRVEENTITQKNYDSQGVLLSSTVQTPKEGGEGFDTDTTTYLYDSKGRLITTTTHTAAGQRVVTTAEYYESGDYIQEVRSYADDADTEGKLVSTANINGRSGRAVKTTTYLDDGTSKIVAYVLTPDGMAKITTHYDANGNEIQPLMTMMLPRPTGGETPHAEVGTDDPVEGQSPVPADNGDPAEGQPPVPADNGDPAEGQPPVPADNGNPVEGQPPVPADNGDPAEGQSPAPTDGGSPGDSVPPTDSEPESPDTNTP